MNPVPFCILDEVDAALDEANIGRFADALRKLSESIDFVVITHNRATIEVADTIYGVTMTDAAVSRVLSLRLADLPGGGERVVFRRRRDEPAPPPEPVRRGAGAADDGRPPAREPPAWGCAPDPRASAPGCARSSAPGARRPTRPGTRSRRR